MTIKWITLKYLSIFWKMGLNLFKYFLSSLNEIKEFFLKLISLIVSKITHQNDFGNKEDREEK